MISSLIRIHTCAQALCSINTFCKFVLHPVSLALFFSLFILASLPQSHPYLFQQQLIPSIDLVAKWQLTNRLLLAEPPALHSAARVCQQSPSGACAAQCESDILLSSILDGVLTRITVLIVYQVACDWFFHQLLELHRLSLEKDFSHPSSIPLSTRTGVSSSDSAKLRTAL